MKDEYIIETDGLTKVFGKLRAVDSLSIKVRRGEVYGFLGPNGAGKTTTVRMLTTMEIPTSGSITVDGYDTRTEYLKARRNIGVIQQQNSLDKDISVKENIMHHALMQNMSRVQAKERMGELCDIMELTDRLDTLVEHLSGGWKKRVSIVCSMIHDPDILFMDEPTTGLDTQTRNLLWKMIRALNRKGTTVFLTTHYIYEAESLCDRIGMIDHGRLVAQGSPAEIIDSVGRFVMVRTVDDDSTVTFFPDRHSAKTAADSFTGEHNTVVRKTTLEDAFLEITGGSR